MQIGNYADNVDHVCENGPEMCIRALSNFRSTLTKEIHPVNIARKESVRFAMLGIKMPIFRSGTDVYLRFFLLFHCSEAILTFSTQILRYCNYMKYVL